MTHFKAGAIALFFGTLLNMFRMMPVFMSDGFSSEAFPPVGAEQSAQAALLAGWYLSHIMAILSVPLLVYGFLNIYWGERERSDSNLGDKVTLAGVFIIATGLALYLVAAVSDGIALSKAASHYLSLEGAEQLAAAVVVVAIHDFAVSFGGHFMALALIGTGIFSIGLMLLDTKAKLPILGVLVGTVGLIGTVTGILDLSFKVRFPLLAGLLGLSMIFWLTLSFKYFKLRVSTEKLIPV